MENQETPLGRAGFLVIPIGIVLAIAFQSFWEAVGVGAVIGALIANVRAVLFIGRFDDMSRNPLMELQAKVQGIDSSMKIRFIFMQSVIGAIIFAAWTAVAAGIGVFLR